MEEEWSDLILHNGKYKPYKLAGCYLEIHFRCGDVWCGMLDSQFHDTEGGAPLGRCSGDQSSWIWGTNTPKWDVTAYRIRTPRSLQFLREMIADELEGV